MYLKSIQPNLDINSQNIFIKASIDFQGKCMIWRSPTLRYLQADPRNTSTLPFPYVNLSLLKNQFPSHAQDLPMPLMQLGPKETLKTGTRSLSNMRTNVLPYNQLPSELLPLPPTYCECSGAGYWNVEIERKYVRVVEEVFMNGPIRMRRSYLCIVDSASNTGNSICILKNRFSLCFWDKCVPWHLRHPLLWTEFII